jgi:hypothetical protein
MEWFLERLQLSDPLLDYEDKTKHLDDFQKLVELQIIKPSLRNEGVWCSFCDEDHSLTPFTSSDGKILVTCSGATREVHPDELKVWSINKDVLDANTQSKDAVVDKKLYAKTTFSKGIKTLPSDIATKVKTKYPSVSEIGPDINWEDLTLKIKSGLEDIEIWYKDKHIKTCSYVDLGFSTTKTNHKPDRLWQMLQILSFLQKTDITQATPQKLLDSFNKLTSKSLKKDSIHKTKQLLVEALQTIFRTHKTNPFYDEKKYYHPKFTILPEAEMRTEELRQQGGELHDNYNYEDSTEIE